MVKTASVLYRIVARLVDLAIVFIAIEALEEAGLFASVLYILIADGLFDGRSIGKRLLELKTVTTEHKNAKIKESILRNMDIAIGVLLWGIPYLGWLIMLAILAVEFIVLMGNEQRKRIGDIIAGTMVIYTGKE